ncbi:uncharacterized protein LOC130733864 isoform X1 [Lotus japonicus]|uniref:uncharacterized protein LOC130733864 isoform X1 n=1 Tax=Lotus japonicus TaxID=34305 RepID=UPI002587D397|nr:uncharacterized protein LOC130733864 isoform X1 [Lotus japonicus]XP_057442127.1 uncharacterized protein LOC130733864 isoform X1 [Lotus japonicus]
MVLAHPVPLRTLSIKRCSKKYIASAQCASYLLPKRALYNMSRYTCCAGYMPCSKRCGESKCLEFCFCTEEIIVEDIKYGQGRNIVSDSTFAQRSGPLKLSDLLAFLPFLYMATVIFLSLYYIFVKVKFIFHICRKLKQN